MILNRHSSPMLWTNLFLDDSKQAFKSVLLRVHSTSTMVTMISSYKPPISLLRKKQCKWLVVPDTDSHVTYSKEYVFYELCTAARLTHWLPYRIVGNFWGRKLSRILRFCGYSFSPQNLGRGVLWHSKASNPRKFSPRKSYFSPIPESFLPRKFPVIRYICMS